MINFKNFKKFNFKKFQHFKKFIISINNPVHLRNTALYHKLTSWIQPHTGDHRTNRSLDCSASSTSWFSHRTHIYRTIYLRRVCNQSMVGSCTGPSLQKDRLLRRTYHNYNWTTWTTMHTPYQGNSWMLCSPACSRPLSPHTTYTNTYNRKYNQGTRRTIILSSDCLIDVLLFREVVDQRQEFLRRR